MTRNVKIALIAFVIIIAINISAIMIGFAGKSPDSTSTPQPGVTATPAATAEPTATDAPGQTPAQTTTPAATPVSTPASTPHATPTSTPISTPAPTPTPASTPAGGGGGGGGTQPTPTQTQTPDTIVSISTVSQVQRGSSFTVDIDIEQVTYLVFAGFDLSFDSNILELEGITAVNWGDEFNSTIVIYNTMEEGLVRVIWDNADWAHNVNNGYGASGSGTLCKVTFTAAAAGTSTLDFVAGQGSPAGELTLLKWVAYIQSEIENVGWNSGSVEVVN